VVKIYFHYYTGYFLTRRCDHWTRSFFSFTAGPVKPFFSPTWLMI